jgi:RNA polymerase sigma-70 factor (ECF subfamily)
MPGRDTAGRAARLVREGLAYADGLHNLAFHLSGNPSQAEDLVQETYARALGAADQFEEGSNLKAWLYRILRNTFIDLYRREQRARTEGGLDTVVENPAAAAVARSVAGEPGQERAVVGHEIERAMSALSDDARMAVLLDLEGWSETEIAGILECAPGTVKSRLFRARAVLRERLRDHGA